MFPNIGAIPDQNHQHLHPCVWGGEVAEVR